MTVTFGNLSTTIAGSASTGKSYTHNCTADTDLLVIWVCLRGVSVNPNNVSVSVNGSPAPMIANSAALNTSNRVYTAFFTRASPPAGALSISVSWSNTSNLVSSAVDLFDVDPNQANAWNVTSVATSASLAVECPIGGIVLDSVITKNGRIFTPNNIIPQYATLESNTGTSDLSHRAGYSQNAGNQTIGWAISSSSDYAYAAIALAPTQQPQAAGNQFFMFFG